MERTVRDGNTKIGDLLMKVAVTGAAGFVGRHVLAELVKHSVDIVAMVQNSSQLAYVDSSVQCKIIDIATPPADVYSALGRPDVLIHLAWGGLPNYKSLHHIESELPHQYNFLADLIKAGLSSLVITGTCFEYGMQSGPLSETLETKPTNPYGYAKDALRRQLEFLRTFNHFAFTWTRLFYLYGEGQAENSLLSQLKTTVKRGDAIFNMSGGEQLRDYLPVNEVAAILVSLALKQADIGIVNICSGEPVSVRSLVEKWLKENNWKIQLNLGHYSYPDYEPMAFWGDRVKLNTFFESI